MDEYVPIALRQESWSMAKHPEAWGIGRLDGHGGMGMTHGPFDSEEEALETVGERGERIVHFFPDGTDKVVWRWKLDRWVKRYRL